MARKLFSGKLIHPRSSPASLSQLRHKGVPRVQKLQTVQNTETAKNHSDTQVLLIYSINAKRVGLPPSTQHPVRALAFIGDLPLDASIRNQPHDGDKDIKKARDQRMYKRQWDRYQITHHRDLAFEV